MKILFRIFAFQIIFWHSWKEMSESDFLSPSDRIHCRLSFGSRHSINSMFDCSNPLLLTDQHLTWTISSDLFLLQVISFRCCLNTKKTVCWYDLGMVQWNQWDLSHVLLFRLSHSVNSWECSHNEIFSYPFVKYNSFYFIDKYIFNYSHSSTILPINVSLSCCLLSLVMLLRQSWMIGFLVREGHLFYLICSLKTMAFANSMKWSLKQE